jgi:hypothetical protein
MEFEKFVRENPKFPLFLSEDLRKDPDGTYGNEATYDTWSGWLAAAELYKQTRIQPCPT